MQGIIDERLRIPDADLVLGIFWNRFGTPTAGEASGSAHEIKQTLSAWREHGRPDLMLFFSRRPASLETAEDARQSVAVREFKESLPSEVGWWNYADHADFEQQLRRQLNDWLRGQGEPAAADEPPAARDDTGLLAAPAYADVVSRDGLSKRLQTAIAAKPLVIVEGLA